MARTGRRSSSVGRQPDGGQCPRSPPRSRCAFISISPLRPDHRVVTTLTLAWIAPAGKTSRPLKLRAGRFNCQASEDRQMHQGTEAIRAKTYLPRADVKHARGSWGNGARERATGLAESARKRTTAEVGRDRRANLHACRAFQARLVGGHDVVLVRSRHAANREVAPDFFASGRAHGLAGPAGRARRAQTARDPLGPAGRSGPGGGDHDPGPSRGNAVAREFVAGHPLGNREIVGDSFFPI